MDLKRKLAALSSAGPGSHAPHAVDTAENPDRAKRILEIRGQIHAIMARTSRTARARTSVAERMSELPFVRRESPQGHFHVRARNYEVTQRHGTVPLHTALDATGDAVATLALDPSLSSFDAATALYLDTETTGLSGGSGTLAFLVGVGRFEGREFVVEQFFLGEPSEERSMLTQLADRIERASALVTFNGKAFDLPLLRSRYVMARGAAPREPPHFDLVHVARRIYGSRLAECKLTTLERDVLGFVRVADVPSGEIPERYANYLRAGETEPLLAVIDHNLWDVIAMAALAGELAARVSGGDASGRFDPADMTGLARSVLRAGQQTLAIDLASTAAADGARLGQNEVAARANTLAARIHRGRKDHGASLAALLEAMRMAPEDADVRLSLAKLYEHRLRDPVKALEHARAAREAEDAEVNQRRVARLEARVAKTPRTIKLRAPTPSGHTQSPPASPTPTRTT